MNRETRISNYVLTIFFLASLALMSLPMAGPIRAFKACLVYLFNPIVFHGARNADLLSGVPSRIGDLIAADMENRLLREQLKRQELLETEAGALRRENDRLRGLVGLSVPPGRRPVWARVMEKDPSRWYHSVMVDAGSDAGVTLNAAVLGAGPEGLSAVGRVVETGPTSSKVLLLSDELSSAAAALISSGTATVEGLVQGQGAENMRMNYLPPDTVPQPGDAVVTSPTSATFPPDLRIGTVAKVYPRDPFLTFLSVEVRPAVSAYNLSEVMILVPDVKPRGPGS